uniref:Beta-arrestin-2 n=4 Tax=Boreoeutheria TaxID=1437010 RepID=A0A8D0QQW8_PIG
MRGVERPRRPRGGVFKKSSPNCKLTVYLGKRDFVDHLDKVDPVDGVVLVDPDYLKDRKVFVTLTCAFRYGREDLDVLGLSFRKDLFIATYQAFPPMPNPPRPPTRLQDRLLRKLGQHAHPFFFTIPQNLPCSVTLQPGPEDTGKACGVDFEIRAFCAKSVEEKSHKRNSVRLVIRKVQFAPEKPGPQPSAETTRHFLMSDRSLHLEASLDKELYYHGEPLNVNVHVTNNSTKTVKKIKVSVRQYADICLFSTAQYKCPVAQLEQDDQVSPSSTFCKVYTITPLLSDNREKRGLALDGKLKHEDTNLASSTIVKEGANKEVLGILVSYRVKVKLVVSRGGDVSVELPFVLMHPKPQEHITLPRPQSGEPATRPSPQRAGPKQGQWRQGGSFQHPPTPPPSFSPQLRQKQTSRWTPTSLNLIPSKTRLGPSSDAPWSEMPYIHIYPFFPLVGGVVEASKRDEAALRAAHGHLFRVPSCQHLQSHCCSNASVSGGVGVEKRVRSPRLTPSLHTKLCHGRRHRVRGLCPAPAEGDEGRGRRRPVLLGGGGSGGRLAEGSGWCWEREGQDRDPAGTGGSSLSSPALPSPWVAAATSPPPPPHQRRTGPISWGTWALIFPRQLGFPNPAAGGTLCSYLSFVEGPLERRDSRERGRTSSHIQPHPDTPACHHLCLPFLQDETLWGARPLCF